MRRTLEGGYELDDDPARLDLDAIWAFLSTEAYWGRDRTRELFGRQVRGAARVMGLYHGDEQVGFERTFTDGVVVYLADVYVLPEHRGRGLGVEPGQVDHGVDAGDLQAVPGGRGAEPAEVAP